MGQGHARDHSALRVVGPEHRAPDIAVERQGAILAEEAGLCAAAPEGENTPARRCPIEREAGALQHLVPAAYRETEAGVVLQPAAHGHRTLQTAAVGHLPA